MKTFTKKTRLFAAAAALLVLAAMLVTTSCGNDMGGGYGGGYTDGFTPPPGKGAVRLNFNKEIARTILPTGTTLTSFSRFDFQFEPAGGGTSKTVEELDQTTVYNPIVLDPGTYTLTVLAYLHIDSDDELAATATVTGVNISRAEVTNATVKLTAYEPDIDGKGTFAYKITNNFSTSANVTGATISLTKKGALGTNIGPTNIISNLDGVAHNLSTAVDAGYYYLDLVITTAVSSVTFRHIVHIYHNLTSEYDFEISEDYFSGAYKARSGTDLVYEGPTDKPLVLTANVTTTTSGTNSVGEGQTVFVAHDTNTVTITISNFTDYDTDSVKWSYDNEPLGTGASITVNAKDGGVFYGKKTYSVFVEGEVSGVPYDTVFNIKVQ